MYIFDYGIIRSSHTKFYTLYSSWAAVGPQLGCSWAAILKGKVDFFSTIFQVFIYISTSPRPSEISKNTADLGPIFLLKLRPLMILLEGFLVRLMIGLTKNPSRRIINGLGLSRKIGPNFDIFL